MLNSYRVEKKNSQTGTEGEGGPKLIQNPTLASKTKGTSACPLHPIDTSFKEYSSISKMAKKVKRLIILDPHDVA